MAASNVLFQVSVRDTAGTGMHQVIPVTAGMTVGDIKRVFSTNTGVPTASYKLVFAGRQLRDSDTLQTLGVQSHSTLHCIRGRFNIETEPTEVVRNVEDKLGSINLEAGGGASTGGNRFFVYCKECKQMQPGKLRVRCNDCKDESFTLRNDPQGWSDVLIKSRLRGTCHVDACGGDRFADFFFKCGGHESRPNVREECVALDMIRTNTVEIECPMCADVKDQMVVFMCDGKDGHSLCFDCFLEYTRLALTERRFTEHRECGYTIKCPNHCEGSFVTEIHHFRLLGDELYERYQRFGTEECLLQMGGVLCPRPNCGMGMLPEDDGRRIRCPECRHTFCRICKSDYHNGDCNAVPAGGGGGGGGEGQQLDEDRLQRSRWNEASEQYIRNHVAIKNCPSCHASIEKDGGCMHMTCRRCHHQFCWLCLIPWGRGCQDRHWFGERN